MEAVLNLPSASGNGTINKDVNGRDMVFEFSGDDDVWVVVDGELLLDIGGIHSISKGSINFATGEITVNSPVGKTTTTIKEGGFSQGDHTLEFYYLERGASDSNCKVQFNITRFGQLEFDKKDGKGNGLEGAVFALYKDPNCTEPLQIPELDDQGHARLREFRETSGTNGHVKFERVPVGTYYMKEESAPNDYDKDDRVYTAKIVVTKQGTETKSEIVWNGTPYQEVVNEKRFPLQITKKWQDLKTGQELEWPGDEDDYKIGYKVIQHVYIEPGVISDSQSERVEITEAQRIVFTASETEGLLTKEHPSYVLQDLSAAGTWTSPLVLTDSQKALGIKENTAYPVKYVYTVTEDVEGSTKPEGSTILLPVEAIVSDAQIEVEPGEEKVDGKEAVLTNIVADLEVVKEWNGGNTGHENDSVTVQLYRLAVPEEGGGGGHGGQQDDSKIEILIDTKWVYPDQTSAEETAIPTNGKISVTVTGDNDPSNTRTVNLEPSSWAIRVSDLDKTDSTGKNITYTVTYNQQYSQFYGKTVLVTTPANASVKGVNGKVTLTAQVEKPTQPEPVNTTMDVPFHVTWKTDKGVEKTPADNAVVIATVRNASGEVVKTVTLNKGNNWSSTETLPCIVNDETMNYTVTYTYSGTNVTNAGGTESFSGSGSQVEIVGVFREVSATRMAVQVVAEGLKGSNNGQSTWHVNMSDGAKGTRGDQNITYYFNPDELRDGQSTSTLVTDMRLTYNDGTQITYRIKVDPQECEGGVITVTNPDGQVIYRESFTGNGAKFIDIPATAGTFVINVTGNGAKANSAKGNAASRSLKAASGAPENAGSSPALKAGSQGTQTFTDDITHSQIQLPADAEAVGNPVTLSYNEVAADSWRHIWNDLPVSDGNGNIYYYYIKEVSATTGADVEEIGAVYTYENLSETDGRIHKVTITNTTTIREIDVNIHKISHLRIQIRISRMRSLPCAKRLVPDRKAARLRSTMVMRRSKLRLTVP